MIRELGNTTESQINGIFDNNSNLIPTKVTDAEGLTKTLLEVVFVEVERKTRLILIGLEIPSDNGEKGKTRVLFILFSLTKEIKKDD